MRALLIVLLIASSTANAAEWVELDDSAGENFRLFVDKASIVKGVPYKKAWFKMVFDDGQKGANGLRFDETWQLVYFDCDDRKLSLAQEILRKEGKAINTETVRTPFAKFEEIAPETRGESMLDFVCKRRRAYKSDPEADNLSIGAPAEITRPVNPDDYYPPGSVRRKEQGSPMVLACVGSTGNLLREPIVTDTSGFPDLDGAAIKVAKATRYAAGMENGAAVSESCIKFKVKFALKR